MALFIVINVHARRMSKVSSDLIVFRTRSDAFYGRPDGLQCTMATAKGRCKGRYCKRCLTNRYGLDMADIMSNGTASRTKEHVKGTTFIFKYVTSLPPSIKLATTLTMHALSQMPQMQGRL